MWFALATLCFWITHIVVDVLLLVGVVKERLLLMPPFVLWCLVGSLWELVFVIESMIEFTSNIQILIILYSVIINVGLPVYFALLVISYVEFLRDQGHVLPGDGIVLKNTAADTLDVNNNDEDKVGIAINQDNVLSSSANTTVDFASPRPAQIQSRNLNLLLH